jgi:hypothetical protein
MGCQCKDRKHPASFCIEFTVVCGEVSKFCQFDKSENSSSVGSKYHTIKGGLRANFSIYIRPKPSGLGSLG